MKMTVVEFGYEGDGVTALYIDGVKHTHGNYYDDKIGKWIEGFVAGLEYAEIGFTHEDHYVPADDCEDICHGGDEPPAKWPDARKKYFKHKLTKDELP
jgi:hypothetical protein